MASRFESSPQLYQRPKGPNWKKLFGISLSIVLAIVVIGGVLVFYFGHSLFSLTNYVSDDTQEVVKAEDLPEEAIETVSTGEHKGTVLNESELNNIHQSMTKIDQKIETVTDDDVYNLLLVGVDRRDKSWNGNSDSMMLVSINFREERVSIISLMRDTYVNIPDVGYAKLNNAYARGGGKLLTATVSDMYNVDVSNYAAVDFENMIEIVDALGGVDLEMTDAEVEIANGYMVDMCNTLGLDSSEYVLYGGGTYHCNGVQAVAYARNRYVGNSDYARTERQRYVISQIIKEVKQMNIAQLNSFAREVLPLVTHNIKESEIWDMVTKAPSILSFKFVQDRVPYDNLYEVIYVDGQDMLVPDWEQTIEKMHETIYGNGSISDNSDNNQEDRTVNNNEFAPEFQEEILNAAGQNMEDGASADGSSLNDTLGDEA